LLPKATRLALGEIEAAKSLETDGLVFLVGDTPYEPASFFWRQLE